jgi:acetyl-CoA acetyltransferase
VIGRGTPAAIVGIGTTAYARRLEGSALELASQALDAALSDAGLRPADVDGLVVIIGEPLGVDYDVFCAALGLSVRFALQSWHHGRFTVARIQEAVLAIEAGLASTVAVVRAVKQSSGAQVRPGQIGGREHAEGARVPNGPHGEQPHYGLTGPGSGAAMAARLYFARYGVSPEKLGAVAVTLRNHASLNPRAMHRTPLTPADYATSPAVIEPLRRLDFATATDGAICLLLTSPERAAGCRRSGVYVRGMQGLCAGRDEFIFARPNLGVQQQPLAQFRPSPEDLGIYANAGIERADVQGFFTYDAFSPLVWFALERFGFCAEGEAPAFCADGSIALGGSLPVNSNGGILSEGHLGGMNHIVEMVEQLRGSAGNRQIPGARILQWGSCIGDAIILAAE